MSNHLNESEVIIYHVEIYLSRRHTKPYKEMYYADEEHTRWVHKHPLGFVYAYKAEKTSEEYMRALKNSNVYEIKDTVEKYEFCEEVRMKYDYLFDKYNKLIGEHEQLKKNFNMVKAHWESIQALVPKEQ